MNTREKKAMRELIAVIEMMTRRISELEMQITGISCHVNTNITSCFVQAQARKRQEDVINGFAHIRHQKLACLEAE
jgi:hypothetical protein